MKLVSAPSRGLATLAVCLLLLLLLTMSAVWMGQHLATAQRVTANDQRAALAGDAAEAGLAWTVAMLNSARVDDDCRASLIGGRDLRERALESGPDQLLHARPGLRPVARCVHGGPQSWRCRCDAGIPLPPDDGIHPAFSVWLSDTSPPGLLRLTSRGCSEAGADCAPAEDQQAAAVGHTQLLALLSGLRHPPDRAVVHGPGAWSRVFEIPPTRYRAQPALTRVDCLGRGGDDAAPTVRCEDALAQALVRGRRFLWIDGDLSLTAPLAAGPDSPLLLLVDGRLDISSASSITGLIYARNGIRWFPTRGGPGELRGAAVTDGPWEAARNIQLKHDPLLLQRLSRQMGSYLPVPGGWSPAP